MIKLTPLILAILACVTSGSAQPTVAFEEVASGFHRPLYVAQPPDKSGRLFLLEKATGLIRIIKPGTGGGLVPTPFLNIGDRLTTVSESGLVGMAFHPDYAKNGRLFVNYIDLNGDTVVTEFHRSAANPDVADPVDTVVFTADQPPYPIHNGGMLEFGPDGYLYIALGDGGTPDDHLQLAQNLEVPFGKILRIDVRRLPYSIPRNNPFYGSKPGLDEIYAYGFRNPWRFSFDRKTGDLFVGDVGHGRVEEVDIVTKGGNYGWSITEGDLCFRPMENCDMTGLIEPIFTYLHDVGCSITGGYVYRGKNIPWLVGKYVYGDFCTGDIYSLEENDDGTWTNNLIGTLPGMLTSFGEDANGEIYAVKYSSGLQSNGGLYRLRDADAAPTDLTGSWRTNRQTCRGRSIPQCSIRSSFSVQNTGAETGNVNVKVFLSEDETFDDGDSLVATYDTGNLRAGQTKSKSLRITLPTGESASGKMLIAVVDAHAAIDETDELNNQVVSATLP